MNDSFDGELSRRLRNYLEEPRMELWQSIITATYASRQPSRKGRKTRITLLLVLCLLSVGGLYYFERTGVVSAESSALISPPKPNNANSEGIAGTEMASDSRIESEGKKPSTIQANERFILRNNPVVAKSVNTSANDIVVEKTTAAASEEASIIPAEDILSPENSSVSKTSSSGEILLRGETAPIVNNEPDASKELSAKAASKKTDDEGKTVIHEKDRRDKFSIYFTIMPTFGYQRINSNSSDNIIIESIDRIATFSTDRLGVRAELGVEDPITDRIKVFGGLVYYQRKQTINYTEKQVEKTEVSTGPGGEIVIVPQYVYVEKSFEYELKNLGVQVGLSYALSKKKLLQTIGTGFEFHVALNKLEDHPQGPEFTNNPSAYLFYNLYYRLQYPAESRLKAVFQPTLNYSFYINQNLNAPFYVKPYGLGLNLGFTYNF